MSDLIEIQRACASLIEEARESQRPATEHSLPIALELFYTAFMMKDPYARGGIKIAQRYAERMGLDDEQVQAFAWNRITEEIDRSRSGNSGADS